MGFKVDFSELEKLVKTLEITEKDFDDFLRDFLIEMVERIINKTRPRTPKESGSLRSGWNISEIGGSGKEIYAIINNPMEYATDIEYGHRIMGGVGRNTEIGWYNGHFMLKTSIDEIDKQLPLRYEKKFKEFCIARGLDVN